MPPIDTFWRLVDSATGRQRHHEPAISTTTAAILSIGFTSLYVLPFYLSPRTRPSPTLNRDAPSVIQARIRAVTITVTLSTLSTFLLLTSQGQYSIDAALHYLGLWPISPIAILQALGLTFTLYLGPLYNDIYLEGSLSPLSEVWARVVTTLSSSMGYRNYMAGPLTEELLFRSTILPIHLLSPLANTPKQLVFLTPLYFGIAHVHHFYEFRLSHPDTPLTPALFRTIFQFAYTTIFGWYAAFIFLRTGNLYAVFIVHTFCNYMGLPRLWGKVSLRSSTSMHKSLRVIKAGPILRGKDDAEVEPLSGSSKAKSDDVGAPAGRFDSRTKHSVIYYTLLLIGVYGFATCLVPLTNFEHLALIKFTK